MNDLGGWEVWKPSYFLGQSVDNNVRNLSMILLHSFTYFFLLSLSKFVSIKPCSLVYMYFCTFSRVVFASDFVIGVFLSYSFNTLVIQRILFQFTITINRMDHSTNVNHIKFTRRKTMGVWDTAASLITISILKFMWQVKMINEATIQ